MDLPTLIGERITLRPARREDAARIYELANHPVVAGMTGMPHPYPGVDGALKWIETTWRLASEDDSLHLAVTRTGEDVLIGFIGYNSIHKLNRAAEVGYWLGEPYWGKGYGVDMLKLMIDYAFGVLDLNRVTAVCRDDNQRSYRVMEKSGMQFEGLARQEAWREGTFRDQRHYAILRQDWPAAQGQ